MNVMRLYTPLEVYTLINNNKIYSITLYTAAS